MKSVRLIIEPQRIEGEMLVIGAAMEHPDGVRHRLWWRLPADWQDAVTPWADPFVVANKGKGRAIPRSCGR